MAKGEARDLMVQLASQIKEAENLYRHRNKPIQQIPASTNFRFLFPVTESAETKTLSNVNLMV